MKIHPKAITLIQIMEIWDKMSGQAIPFILWKKQNELLRILHTKKRIVILKKRQVGLSQLTGADSLAQAMLNKSFTVLVLSKTGDDAKEYLKRVKEMYHSLHDVVKNQAPLSKVLPQTLYQPNKEAINYPDNIALIFH